MKTEKEIKEAIQDTLDKKGRIEKTMQLNKRHSKTMELFIFNRLLGQLNTLRWILGEADLADLE